MIYEIIIIDIQIQVQVWGGLGVRRMLGHGWDVRSGGLDERGIKVWIRDRCELHGWTIICLLVLGLIVIISLRVGWGVLGV